MKKIATIAIAVVLALSLAACGGQSHETEASAAGQAIASVDVSSWKTLGDALAADPGTNTSASYNESYYITAFDVNDSPVRVVAKIDPDLYAKVNNLDFGDDEYRQKLIEVIGGAEIVSAEDLSSKKLSQDELNAYVGKTGHDLLRDGFVFESYWLYGKEQIGVTMGKGMLAYDVMFDVTVTEDESEDEGASIKGAPIVEISYVGASMEARDPSKIAELPSAA